MYTVSIAPTGQILLSPLSRLTPSFQKHSRIFAATQQLFSRSPDNEKVTCCMTKRFYFKIKYISLPENADSMNRKGAKNTRKFSKLRK